MKWLRFLLNVPMALLAGICLGIAMTWWLGADISEEIKRYGTYLTTAVVTLFASGIALATTIWHGESIRERKLRAAKASLPLALSKLTSIAKSGFRNSIQPTSFLTTPSNASVVELEVEIPDDVFETLKECIESSDPVSAQWIANLVAHYQVYRARLVGGIEDPDLAKDDRFRAQHASEWMFLHSIISHLFNFARGGEAADIQLDSEAMRSGFIFELARSGMRSEIVENFEALKKSHLPLSASSVSFADR